MSRDEVKTVMAALAAAFDPSEVKFKPGAVSGNRALALAYVDTRTVQDRLDEVLGIDGWQDQYTPLPDGSVVCELRCRIGSEWIIKTDVGGPSEQPDGGDRLKAAFSDALKRAAVKFGIGRYLYRLPSAWCDWDPARKRFIKTPQLPAGGAGTEKTAPGSHPQLPKRPRRPTTRPPTASTPNSGPPSWPCARRAGSRRPMSWPTSTSASRGRSPRTGTPRPRP
jgi:hypothetical protein